MVGSAEVQVDFANLDRICGQCVPVVPSVTIVTLLPIINFQVLLRFLYLDNRN